MATHEQAVAAVEFLRAARALKPQALDAFDTEASRIAQRAVEEGLPLNAALRAAVVAAAAKAALGLGPEYATADAERGWYIVRVEDDQIVAVGTGTGLAVA